MSILIIVIERTEGRVGLKGLEVDCNEERDILHKEESFGSFQRNMTTDSLGNHQPLPLQYTITQKSTIIILTMGIKCNFHTNFER